jgi:hypothetical protein
MDGFHRRAPSYTQPGNQYIPDLCLQYSFTPRYDLLLLLATCYIEPYRIYKVSDQVADIAVQEFIETVSCTIKRTADLDATLATIQYTREMLPMLEYYIAQLKANINTPTRDYKHSYKELLYIPIYSQTNIYNSQLPSRKRRSGDSFLQFDRKEEELQEV